LAGAAMPGAIRNPAKTTIGITQRRKARKEKPYDFGQRPTQAFLFLEFIEFRKRNNLFRSSWRLCVSA
jgi:hypothetical protein